MSTKTDYIKQAWTKYGSTILAGFGCAGVVGTGLLAYRAGKNPESNILKIPSLVVGGITIAAIVLSKSIDGKAIAALTAAGSYVVLNRDKLEKEIEDRYGKEELAKIKAKIREALLDEFGNDRQTQERTGNGDLLCLEGYSGRIFRSSKEAVDRAIEELTNRFDEGEYVCLNDLYKLLGIEVTHFGHQFGWPANPDYCDGPLLIEAEYIENPDGYDEPLYCIDIYTYPMECWLEV